MQNQNSLNHPVKYIQVPASVLCQFNQEGSFHKCSFEIKNICSSIIYLNVTSSFGKFMQIQVNLNQIKPGQTKMFSARLRAPNQIYPHQFIGIMSSPYQLNNFSAFLGPQYELTKIKLQFKQEMMEDQTIENIVKQQANNAHQSALNMLKASQFKQARDLAQQAYGLYRKNLSYLITIAQAQYKMGQYARSAKAIQIFFYVQQHEDFYKAIIIKAETILNFMNTVAQPLKLPVAKNIMQQLKKSIQKNEADEFYQNRCNAVMAKFQQIKHEMLSTQRDGYFDQLLEKSIQLFDKENSNATIKSSFNTMNQYKDFLKNLKNKQLKSSCETPQYALDPINYQIYKQPVITPNGMSYERQFIVNFFKMHGPQDPFTRTYLDPNSIVNNYTLKILVRNNPNLPKWIKYESQVTKF